MTARLHVLLGGGGVGKTTLAAGYALALAQRGGHVGLLGIDPSRRLQDALGLELSDLDQPVPGTTALRAAIVHPHQALQRWTVETCPDRDTLARLERNSFFAAMGDRLATATDILAAVRIAEWAERDPELTDLVVDTAPGFAAVDFLRSPRQVEALVDGALVRWLRGQGVGFVARRALGLVSRITGARTVTDLSELFTLAHPMFEHMLVRISAAQRWLQSPATELLIVTSPRDTGAGAAGRLVRVLREEKLAPRALILNRTWPVEVAAELAAIAIPVGAEPLVGYVRAEIDAQVGVLAAATALAMPVVTLGSRPALDRNTRPALVELGAALVQGLEALPGRSPLARAT
jgi:arsenite-transporting ATPase